MVKLIGRKIPNIYIIGALLLLAYSKPGKFTGATGAVSTLGDTLKSLGTGSTALIRGVLPFSELGEEFTGFAKGFDDLLNPISRLVDIGGRLIPIGKPPMTVSGPHWYGKGGAAPGEFIGPPAPDPADVAIPPGTPVPPVIIYGDDYGG
jgi:flavin-dependent dehydrogenase